MTTSALKGGTYLQVGSQDLLEVGHPEPLLSPDAESRSNGVLENLKVKGKRGHLRAAYKIFSNRELLQLAENVH